MSYNSYKAIVRISGAKDQPVYGKNMHLLVDRATKLLTAHKPGDLGGIEPVEFEVYYRDGSRWNPIAKTFYKDLHKNQHEWRRREAARLSKSIARGEIAVSPSTKITARDKVNVAMGRINFAISQTNGGRIGGNPLWQALHDAHRELEGALAKMD